jgi:hypothetical protein
VPAYTVARPGAQASFPDRVAMQDLLHASVRQAASFSVPSSQAR